MPSKHQSGAKTSTDYQTVVADHDRDDDTFVDAVVMLSTKNDPTIRALIRGYGSPTVPGRTSKPKSR